MHEEMLDKTTRINLLFDFYAQLLTDKQRVFLKYYFHEDFSLGEIASEFRISRQAVYEHVKRAEQVLEDCESKLGLLARYEALQGWLDRLDKAVDGLQDQAAADGLRGVARGLRQTVEGE